MDDALKSPDTLIKISAIRVLQRSPHGDEHVQQLITVLEDSDRLVRTNAAIALGRVRNPIAVIPLIRHAVIDHDEEVRSYALWAYRQMDYLGASQQLIELLTADNNRVIRFAANEIRQKNDVKAIEIILQRFQSQGIYVPFDLDIRAANALYEIGGITIDPLIKCLDDEDMRVQINAIYTLGKIGDGRAVIPLIDRLASSGTEVRSRISDALIRIGPPGVPDLIKLLEHNDRDIKWIAAYALGKIGPVAEPGLMSALKARGDEPSEEVIYALGNAGTADSFLPLHSIHQTTRDDSVRAWSTISLASITARNYREIVDKKIVDDFMDSLGDQLKPHMTLEGGTLFKLGKIYVIKALQPSATDLFATNLTLAIKCFDLSIIESETFLAKAYRLFYGSYIKLMASVTRSQEIIGNIERDFIDLKKDAEKANNKRGIMLSISDVLSILRKAYADRGYDFPGRFMEYMEACASIERFMPIDEGPREKDRKQLSQKESAKLHEDIETAQRKINTLIERFEVAEETDSAAQALRLSTELAKMDTGIQENDYRVVESCLKNIVNHMKTSMDEKSELYVKILMIGKNGIPQVETVMDQLLKNLSPATMATQKPSIDKPGTKAKGDKRMVEAEKKKAMLMDYVIIAVLIILIVLVLVLALNKLNLVHLPFRFSDPLGWLNSDVALFLDRRPFFG